MLCFIVLPHRSVKQQATRHISTRHIVLTLSNKVIMGSEKDMMKQPGNEPEVKMVLRCPKGSFSYMDFKDRPTQHNSTRFPGEPGIYCISEMNGPAGYVLASIRK